MPVWDVDQYLQFADERTRPCHDLAARVLLELPKTIVDLGCGPGNSTAVLAARWPGAAVTGVDSAPRMIQAARQSQPAGHWLQRDISYWKPDAAVDLIFSNAALQWVPDHAALLPRLFEYVNPGGAMAVQVPGNIDSPAHVLMREMAASASWRPYFNQGVRQWHAHPLSFYYDLLAPHASCMDLWETQYLHVLPDAAAIVQWYKGTGLRPFLELLPDDLHRQQFIAEYAHDIAVRYPARSDGKALFPFRRLFFVAYRA